MVGANNELKLMIEGWNKDQLEEFCAARRMKWQFITPLAPHQKSVKQAMKKAIGDALLTPFELYTCVLEAANLVNQWPIGRVPTDPDDGGSKQYWAELRTLCLKVRSEKHEILATGSSFVRESLILSGKSGQETSYHY
jgi:hypothetical protein